MLVSMPTATATKPYMIGATCPFCGARLLPKHLAFISHCRITELRTCCSKLNIATETIPNHIRRLFNARGIRFPFGGSITFDDRVSYILRNMVSESWVAALLVAGIGINGRYKLLLDNDELVLRTYSAQNIFKDTRGRLVRLVRKVFYGDLIKLLNDADFEAFHNTFSSQLINTKFIWRVVQGEAVRDWYNKKTYAKACGQLNSSCMSSEHKGEYLDLYVKNPKRVKLLTIRSADKKLHGRALMWTLDDGRKYLDRAYANDILIPAIYAWGKERKMLTYADSENIELIVTLDYNEMTTYPYMDTMAYYNKDKGILRNYEASLGDELLLEDEDGGWSTRDSDDYYDDYYDDD